MTLNPHLGYELGPGRSYNSQVEILPPRDGYDLTYTEALHQQVMLRQYQARLEQEALYRMGIPLYINYQPPQARTEMKNWLRVLQDDIHTNHTRINALEVEPQQPVATEDAKLMQTELHVRKLLADVLTQRASTEAAKQAMKG